VSSHRRGQFRIDPSVEAHFANSACAPHGYDTLRDQDVRALCILSRHPNVHAKVSAFYGFGKKRLPYSDLVPLVQALYNAYGPKRLMWGSDSPGPTSLQLCGVSRIRSRPPALFAARGQGMDPVEIGREGLLRSTAFSGRGAHCENMTSEVDAARKSFQQNGNQLAWTAWPIPRNCWHSLGLRCKCRPRTGQ
jgi:Amidohydrolase